MLRASASMVGVRFCEKPQIGSNLGLREQNGQSAQKGSTLIETL
jgi:hypothetical protein